MNGIINGANARSARRRSLFVSRTTPSRTTPLLVVAVACAFWPMFRTPQMVIFIIIDVARGSRDQLVEVPAIKPDTATLPTEVNVDALAVTNHQVSLARGAAAFAASARQPSRGSPSRSSQVAEYVGSTSPFAASRLRRDSLRT
jgi:hypothetical protein